MTFRNMPLLPGMFMFHPGGGFVNLCNLAGAFGGLLAGLFAHVLQAFVSGGLVHALLFEVVADLGFVFSLMVLQHGFGDGEFHAFEHGVDELLLGVGGHAFGLSLGSLLEDHGLEGVEAGEAELLSVVFVHFGEDFAADLAELHAQFDSLAAQGFVDVVFRADHGAGALFASLEAADDVVELGEFLAVLGFGELDGVVLDLHAGNGLAFHIAVHVDGDHVAGSGQAFFGHVFEGSGALEQAAGEVGDFFFSEFEAGHFHGEGGKVFGELHVGKSVEGEGELQFLAAHDGVAIEFEAGHGLEVFFAEDGSDALLNEELGSAAHDFAGEALFDDGSGHLALAEAGQGNGSAHFLGGGGEAGVDFFSGDDDADLAVEFGNDFDAVRHGMKLLMDGLPLFGGGKMAEGGARGEA